MSFEIISDLDQTTSNTQLYSLEIVLQMWTLCTMQIKEDMDTMFKEDSLPPLRFTDSDYPFDIFKLFF